MKLSVTFTLLAVVSVAGCAKSPSAIAPANIPMSAYTGQNCSVLAQELVQERSTLAVVSNKQKNARVGDTIGVFLIAVPASSVFGGDKAGDVAVSKGKVQAIEMAMKSKSCK